MNVQDTTSDQRSLERRQLTVMFCDLVESTAIAEQLGVEAWRDFLEGYQEACAKVVRKHGGSVHEYMGDGLLVYFGFPIAREDSAHRAVRAGIEIAHDRERCFAREHEKLGNASIGPLQVRIGIHTGPVVIGELSGRVRATGSTVACAERLQELASPNSVVISEETLALIKDHFEVESLGSHPLRGFDRNAECYIAKFEATVERKLTPFIGRSHEMTLLRQEWRAIQPNSPRVVLIRGDAGIGKSRLIHEFRAALEGEGAQVFEWKCSPYFRNNALYPISQSLRQLLRSARGARDGDDLAAIESLIPEPEEIAMLAPAIAALLSIPYESRYAELTGTPEQQRSQIEEAIVQWLTQMANRRPVLIVVEDVNWSDPSTLELIGRLCEDSTGGPVLVVLAYRIEGADTFTYPFAARPITLGRLSDEAAEDMIASTPGGRDLPESTVQLLVERTDGVPLFIEESATMAVHSLSSGTGPDKASVRDARADYSIPSTIQDLLTQRLSSVGPAKATAQVAAAIGRDFSLELLQAVTETGDSDVIEHLETLSESGLILTEVSAIEHQYSFKHALVRDAAYASMVTTDRRTLHARIAQALEHGAVSGQAAEPELLAYHFGEAGDYPRAIEHWLEAGLRAKRRSAQTEATNHYERALELLAGLPADTDVDVETLELAAQRSLAACHTAVLGYSSAEARNAYQRAEELAAALDDETSLLKARFGLAGYNMMRGDFARAFDIAESCVQMAEEGRARIDECENGDQRAARLLGCAQAAWVSGNVLFHQAEFKRAMPHLERGVRLCRSSTADQRRLMQDPAVMCLVYQSLYLWLSGYPDKALQTVQEGVNVAQAAGHPFSIGVALSFKACVHFFRREYQLAVDAATESISVSEEPGFRTWLAWAKVLRGRALSEWEEPRETGITEILEGLHMWDETGAIVTRPFSLVLLAEAYRLDGQYEKALDRVRKAQEMVAQYGERFYEAEINWLYGKLVLDMADANDQAAMQSAEDAYLAAIDFAKERDMLSTVLHVSIDLSRLRWEQGLRTKAIEELEAALAPLTEGFGTGDYRTAKALLAAMRDDDAADDKSPPQRVTGE